MNCIPVTVILISLCTQNTVFAEESLGKFKDPAVENVQVMVCRSAGFPSKEEREAEAQRTDGCPCFVPHDRLSNKQENGCYVRKGNLDNYSDGFVCTYFSGSAKLCEETPYAKGVKEGVVRRYDYSPGGKTLHSEIPFKSNKEEGVGKFYRYYSGELENEINYTNGIKDGVAKNYFKSGKVQKEILYKGGSVEGVVKAYDENGKDITHTVCLHPSVKCLPEQEKTAIRAFDERKRESGITTGPFTVDVTEWFAYVNHYQAGQVVFLSKRNCPVRWAGKSAMNAKVFVPMPQTQIPACWYESSDVDDNGNAILVVCRRDLKEIGNSCNRYSKRYFLSTQSLPRSGF